MKFIHKNDKLLVHSSKHIPSERGSFSTHNIAPVIVQVTMSEAEKSVLKFVPAEVKTKDV